MIIRQEKVLDYPAIGHVVKTAFESAEHADGNEHDLVTQLRKSDGFIPELALVAEDNGKILGHIMFTAVTVGDHTGLALAPLSVHPEAQRQGIGTTLMRTAHDKAQQMGFLFSVVLGNNAYYNLVGYQTAKPFGILAPFDVPDEYFMVLFWTKNTHDIKGTVQYVKELAGS